MKKKYICLLFVLILCVFVGFDHREGPVYTIMIYMNGSDLESDFGLATDDLAEILDSGLLAHHANLLILTGGTYRWQNGAIPAGESIIWQFENGKFNEIKSLGLANMGNPQTLSDFINFATENYPAPKYGLIMWDHGGGSIAGFGHDENFDDDALTLNEMGMAFENTSLKATPLEFLGFDACLMATVEMGLIARDYAKVLIASEDLEPGEGWDYRFLEVFNRMPDISGAAVGQVIVDSFIDFFPPDTDEILTLSVVGLDKIALVAEAMEALMMAANGEMDIHFDHLAIRRYHTKTFGEGTARDNYADMVDIGDMAKHLQDLYPTEVAKVLDALNQAVLYNRHNSDVDLYGLSTFYVYGGKSIGAESLAVYGNLGVMPGHKNYQADFLQGLKSRQNSTAVLVALAMLRDDYIIGLLQTDTPGEYLWPHIYGHPVPLHPIGSTENTSQYAIPAIINGEDADIIIAFSEKSPDGKILGYRQVENVFQKGTDPLITGDIVTLLYPHTNKKSWAHGNTFTIGHSPQYLSWEEIPDGTLALLTTNACQHTSVKYL